MAIRLALLRMLLISGSVFWFNSLNTAGILGWYIKEKMIRGKELRKPTADMLVLVRVASMLSFKFGFRSLLNRQTPIIANTT